MKSFQVKYDSPGIFEWQLKHIKSECKLIGRSDVIFYLAWKGDSRDCLKDITDCIERHFPDAIYYGNEGSGNIINGELTYGVAITCLVFEDNDTDAELVWVEEGTKYGSLDDLWNYCRTREGLRAVELIPSITYLNTLRIENSIPNMPKDVVIFGGASVDYGDTSFEADIIAKDHPLTKEGMAVILYYGSELNVSYNYVLGWRGLGRYMKVTRSHDKVIEELDDQPAFSVYEKYLGINDNDRANLIFPLIVEEDGVEYIRTPQGFLPDKSMRMFANISEGLMARIAYGDKNTILNSLGEKAVQIAEFKPQVLKAYSCAARRLFWGDDEVCKETLPLQEIAPISGFYTGGEILRFGNKLKVLNSTLVVIGFREGSGTDMEVRKVTRIDTSDKSLISRITHFVEVVADEQQQALELANEEKRRNDILHDIIHSGQWSFRIDANDEVCGAYYSDEAKRIVNNDFSSEITSWVDVLHPDDKEVAYEAFRAAIEDHTCNTPYDVTYRMRDRNGEYHWFHSAGRVIRDETGMGEFFGIHIDITDQINEQLQQKQQLEDALVMADMANHAKTEFLFNMSHDIRTPMNAILGFTNMAIRHVDDAEKAKDCLAKIQQSGDLLLQLINSVLEVSRIESGKAVLEEQSGDVYYSFADIENTMQVMAQTKDIRLTFEFGEITDRYVFCDFSRCSRIFVNIISNAIKYTGEGGFVKVRCEQVESERDGYGVYRYTFRDNGQGMSEEFQKHVYDQFAREHSSTITGIQGTGLGMAVCKSFVDLMGGTITCDSKLGEGTLFTVVLPFKIQKEAKYIDPVTKELVSAGGEAPTHESVDFAGKRILLVEDNELNREIAMEILEEEGFAADMAENGQLAVNIVKQKGPDYYDYILMDIQMPVMNGYEATKAIREMYPDVHIPIIALSANAFAEDRAASFTSGMDDHVSKPINIKELMSCLMRVKKKKRTKK